RHRNARQAAARPDVDDRPIPGFETPSRPKRVQNVSRPEPREVSLGDDSSDRSRALEEILEPAKGFLLSRQEISGEHLRVKFHVKQGSPLGGTPSRSSKFRAPSLAVRAPREGPS